MIRPAKLGEITEILNLTRACAQHMIDSGIEQWNELYPSEESFVKDLNRSELYVMQCQDKLVGCIAVSTLMDKEYETVKWLTPSGQNLYIHRLAVHPDYQGKGLARQMMDMAENLGRNGSFLSVRLDTFSRNERNQRFYETRGYQKLEPVFFPKQSPYPFYCYELIL